VDIQQIAVEIAKLRFFISLVVDEKIDKGKENWGIEPLPNLDFKIMQGNSLISEFLGIDFDNGQTKQEQAGVLFFKKEDKLIKEFEQKKIDFQNESDKDKKAKLKNEIEDLMIKIFETKVRRQKADYFRLREDIEIKYATLPNKKTREEIIAKEKQKLSKKTGFDLENIEKQLREFTSKNKTKPFFAWKLYFAEVFEKGGFDVVIANPPYLSSKNIDESLKPVYEKIFYSPTAHYDIYIIFMEKALQLLKPGGNFCFITSNKYFSQKYGSNIREILLKKQILRIISFNFKIFEATVDTAITIVKNTDNKSGHKIKTLALNETDLKNKGSFLLGSILFEEGRYKTTEQAFFKELPDFNFRLDVNKKDFELREKIISDTLSLEDICFVIYGAVLHNADKKIKKDRFIFEESDKGLKPYIEGKFISRWRVNKINYLKYSPNIHREPRYSELFENHKLVGKRIIGRDGLSFLYDQNHLYADNTVYIVVPYHSLPRNKYSQLRNLINDSQVKISKEYSLLFLLSIINSHLFKWLFQKFFSFGLDIYPIHIKKLPIKVADDKEQKPFIDLVDKILAITKDDYLKNLTKQVRVRDYEKQIDQLVYKLYDLTPEEIKIVENDK